MYRIADDMSQSQNITLPRQGHGEIICKGENQMKTKCNRRDFLKSASLTVAGLTTLSVFGAHAEEKKKKKAESSATGGAAALADPTKGKAKELQYVEDVSHVKDPALKVEKMGVPFAKQACHNCILYQAKGNGIGVCTLMLPDPKHMVKENGWCMSWAKNPNATT